MGAGRQAVGENDLVKLLSDGNLDALRLLPAGVGFDQATLVLGANGAHTIWHSVSSLGTRGGELAPGGSPEVGRSPVGSGGTTHGGGTVDALAADGKALHIGFEQQGLNSQGGGCVFGASAISE